MCYAERALRGNRPSRHFPILSCFCCMARLSLLLLLLLLLLCFVFSVFSINFPIKSAASYLPISETAEGAAIVWKETLQCYEASLILKKSIEYFCTILKTRRKKGHKNIKITPLKTPLTSTFLRILLCYKGKEIM